MHGHRRRLTAQHARDELQPGGAGLGEARHEEVARPRLQLRAQRAPRELRAQRCRHAGLCRARLQRRRLAERHQSLVAPPQRLERTRAQRQGSREAGAVSRRRGRTLPGHRRRAPRELERLGGVAAVEAQLRQHVQRLRHTRSDPHRLARRRRRLR